MKTLVKLLSNSLEYWLELGVARTGIVKYATTTNAFLWGSSGKIERMVTYSRNGKQILRTRPHHFNIKDPGYWKGRNERFKELMQLVKSTNRWLDELYEIRPEKGTFYNLLISQMGNFWTGGPAPALYTFTPGAVEVRIGNGTMPYARNVVFTAVAGGNLQIAWDTSLELADENNDDVLQLMLITKNGSFGAWLPSIGTPAVTRDAGSCIFTVPDTFLQTQTMQVWCAVKFKAGAELNGKVNGIFKFPVGMTPITLMP